MKHNTKAFYQFISSKTTKKDCIPDLINEKGDKTKDDTEKSEILKKNSSAQSSLKKI